MERRDKKRDGKPTIRALNKECLRRLTPKALEDIGGGGPLSTQCTLDCCSFGPCRFDEM